MPEFTCQLKQYRVAKGLTQEQLADKSHVRRETIMRLEKAQYNPSLKLAIDISVLLINLSKSFLSSIKGFRLTRTLRSGLYSDCEVMKRAD